MAILKINRLLSIATNNMYMEFEIEIIKQSWVTPWEPCRLIRKPKDPIWLPGGHLKVASLKMDMLLPIDTGNVLLKVGSDIQSRTKVRGWKPKNPIWPPGAIFKMTLLKINQLLPIYTSIMLQKFGVDIQSQTKVRVWKQKKNQIWLTGNHFGSDVAENQ